MLRHLLTNSTVHCKLGSHKIVSGGRDALVAYPVATADADQVIGVLSTYITANPTHVVDQPVRFTVRVAPGLSHVQDPQNMESAWQALGEGLTQQELVGRTLGERWCYAMSWSTMVSELITRAYRTTASPETFVAGVSRGLHDIGFDHRTGAVAAPTLTGLPWVLDRFFPPRSPSDDESG